MARIALNNVRQEEAARAFTRAGGENKGQSHGHLIIKMPNGMRLSLPTGTLREGLLRSEIKKAGLTPEQFEELL